MSKITKEQFRKSSIMKHITHWSNVFELPILDKPQFPDKKRTDLAISLIREEVTELKDAIDKKDMEETMDAIGDTLWVTIRCAMELGLHNDLEAIIEEIYDSNMTKSCISMYEAEQTIDLYKERGIECYVEKNKYERFIIKRKSDGKIQKSIKFREPNFNHIIEKIIEND